MNFSSILQEISSWSVEDRMRLVQAVCDDLPDQIPADRLEDWEVELERRDAELEVHPDRAERWEQLDAFLRRAR